jgi:proteasome lid subunit RPN8/RPN11
MLEATRNATVFDEDGSRHFLFAGSRSRLWSRVREDSFLATKYPDLFRPMADSAARSSDLVRVTADGAALSPVRQVPPVACRPTNRGLEPWRILPSGSRCRVASSRSPVNVRLSAAARAQIITVLDHDGAERETGGLLVGRSGTGLLQVLLATGPGANAIREPDRFRIDPALEADLMARLSERKGSTLSVIGAWHSHPQGHRSCSREDLDAASTRRRELGDDPCLELLAVPTGEGWDFSGWVVRPEFSNDVAELATI